MMNFFYTFASCRSKSCKIFEAFNLLVSHCTWEQKLELWHKKLIHCRVPSCIFGCHPLNIFQAMHLLERCLTSFGQCQHAKVKIYVDMGTGKHPQPRGRTAGNEQYCVLHQGHQKLLTHSHIRVPLEKPSATFILLKITWQWRKISQNIWRRFFVCLLVNICHSNVFKNMLL